jgi:hypothetical protein
LPAEDKILQERIPSVTTEAKERAKPEQKQVEFIRELCRTGGQELAVGYYFRGRTEFSARDKQGQSIPFHLIT